VWSNKTFLVIDTFILIIRWNTQISVATDIDLIFKKHSLLKCCEIWEHIAHT
jgi:hypothetical protein